MSIRNLLVYLDGFEDVDGPAPVAAPLAPDLGAGCLTAAALGAVTGPGAATGFGLALLEARERELPAARSRARDLIFGGVTRTLLSPARLPCLMVH